MADPSATVVDCGGDKDLTLVRNALKYIRTRDYPAGFLRDCLQERKQHCVHSNLHVFIGASNNHKRVIRRKAQKLSINKDGEVVYSKKGGKTVNFQKGSL